MKGTEWEIVDKTVGQMLKTFSDWVIEVDVIESSEYISLKAKIYKN